MSRRCSRSARRRRPPGDACSPPRAADPPMTMVPDFEAFARAYQAGAASVAVTTLVADLETPVSAYLKLAPRALGQHVPARVGRGRRAARALFDDRPRPRRRLSLDRRSGRDQPPRACRSRRVRALPRRSAGGAAGAARRIADRAAAGPAADVGGRVRLSRLRHGAPDGAARAGKARSDRRARGVADPPDDHGRVRRGARRDGDRDAGSPRRRRDGEAPRTRGARAARRRSSRRSKPRSTTRPPPKPTRC